MGRPSIDPELMIRMLVVGYVFAIRSERLICREVQVNLAYRWFCKLGIEDAVPDHSAFSRARNERFREGDVFRRVFERVVEACIAAGLVGGEGFAVDASLIAADANKQRSIAGHDWRRDRDPQRSSRAVKEYLATLDDTACRVPRALTLPNFAHHLVWKRVPPSRASMISPALSKRITCRSFSTSHRMKSGSSAKHRSRRLSAELYPPAGPL